MQKDIIIARPAKYVSRLDIYLEGGYYLIMYQNDFYIYFVPIVLGCSNIVSKGQPEIRKIEPYKTAEK